MIKAALFDLDGVIIDSRMPHYKAWKQFLYKKKGINLSFKEFKKRFGEPNTKTIRDFFGYLPNRKFRQLVLEKEKIFFKIAKKELKLTKGFLNFIKNLKKEKFMTAVGSSSPDIVIEFVFKRFKIKRYFDVVIGEFDVKKHKPAPEVYLKAAKRLKVSPNECVVFEDSLIGLKSAKNAKMKSIALTTSFPRNKLKANKIIDNFKEIDIERLRGM